jgi:hypothetical protein
MIKSYKITKTLALAGMLVGSTVYAADPTFILKNGSSAGAIQVDIMQNGNSLSGRLISIAKGDEYATNIPTSNLTTIELHYCKTSASCKTELPEKMIAQFPKGKTIYIKYDGKQLEAQKGSFGKTTGKYSGLSMDNNVTKNEIKITHAKTSKADLGMPISMPEAVEIAWEVFPDANALRLGGGSSEEIDRLVLGVSASASKAELTKAYRSGALLYHPDKYEGLSKEKQNKLPKNKMVRDEVFKIFSSAYENLK